MVNIQLIDDILKGLDKNKDKGKDKDKVKDNAKNAGGSDAKTKAKDDVEKKAGFKDSKKPPAKQVVVQKQAPKSASKVGAKIKQKIKSKPVLKQKPRVEASVKKDSAKKGSVKNESVKREVVRKDDANDAFIAPSAVPKGSSLKSEISVGKTAEFPTYMQKAKKIAGTKLKFEAPEPVVKPKQNVICLPTIKRKKWAAREGAINVCEPKAGKGKWALKEKAGKTVTKSIVSQSGVIGSNEVKTVFDKMYSIVSVRKSVAVKDLSKSLAIKEGDVLELARIFEETGRMKIFYPLMGSPKIVFTEKGDLE